MSLCYHVLIRSISIRTEVFPLTLTSALALVLVLALALIPLTNIGGLTSQDGIECVVRP